MRVIQDDNDDTAFERIINVPKRSIGPVTFNLIKAYKEEHRYTYMEAIRGYESALVQKRAPKKQDKKGDGPMLQLYKTIRGLQNELDEMTLDELIDQLLIKINYKEHLKTKSATVMEAGTLYLPDRLSV